MERQYSEYFDFEKTGLSPSNEMRAAHKIAADSGISPAMMAGKTRAALFLQALLPEEKEHLALIPLLHHPELTAEDYENYDEHFSPEIVALLTEASLTSTKDDNISPDIMTCFLAKKVGMISIMWDCRDILSDAETEIRTSLDALEATYNKAKEMPIEEALLSRAKQLIDDIHTEMPARPKNDNTQSNTPPSQPKSSKK